MAYFILNLQRNLLNQKDFLPLNKRIRRIMDSTSGELFPVVHADKLKSERAEDKVVDLKLSSIRNDHGRSVGQLQHASEQFVTSEGLNVAVKCNLLATVASSVNQPTECEKI